MVYTYSDIVVYTGDTTGLAALSAAVVSAALSAANIVMCPVGDQIAMLSYK